MWFYCILEAYQMPTMFYKAQEQFQAVPSTTTGAGHVYTRAVRHCVTDRLVGIQDLTP